MQLRIAQAQISPVFGDYAANLARFGELAAQAVDEGCELLALPETALSGYFLEGAVIEVARPATTVLADLCASYRASCPASRPLDVLVGFYELYESNVYNSALYATLDAAGEPALLHVHRKVFLPTYGVFDEQRFVARGHRIGAFETRFGRAAILICEDVWHSVAAAIAALRGARFIHTISSSPARGFAGEVPWNVRKWWELLQGIAEEHAVFVTHTARVGFENGKGFAGGSAAVAPDGRIMARGPSLGEALLCTTLDLDDLSVARANQPLGTDLAEAAGDLATEFADAVREARGEGAWA